MHRVPQYTVEPLADQKAIIQGDQYRFTLLADGLFRYEWAPDGCFEDRPSTFALNRHLPVPAFHLEATADGLEIITSKYHLTYDRKPFSPSGFTVQVLGKLTDHQSFWRYGMPSRDLGGTVRTLDGVDGRTALEPGVLSWFGYSVIDDSTTMLFDGDWVAPRRPGPGRVDGYMFAFGHDYKSAMQAFYALSGDQPLLPRWALGNWWSRYHSYSAEEYLALMDRFRHEGLPLAVGVLDMGWHLVEHEKVIGSGWTGYTWDRELFPDPKAFLAEMRKRNLKTTPNVHPAEGIKSHEDAYVQMCEAVGQDPAKGHPIPFDLTNRVFLNAYFDVLHRQLEQEGIDFWWVDWQSGSHSRIAGIDPLWMLNHFHFLDNARDGNRPLAFSRYAGPGSHRYPIGFSGDTIVTWASLNFQPEFTATASNIGYGWWSHDVGGHMFGHKDDELATRWVQLGVYSPILRLHSSCNMFNTKEPWMFNMEAREIMNHALRWRHRLLPYLYTMNVRAARDREPLVQPIYWAFPDCREAYECSNQFFFGSELIVCPITSPRDKETQLGRIKAWIPPGRQVDLFTGVVYDGDRTLWLSRPLHGIPVLAKEGSIITLDGAAQPLNGGENPDSLEVMVVVGADGTFDMLEDDGSGIGITDVKLICTHISFDQESGVLRIQSPMTAKKRRYHIQFLALQMPADIKVSINGMKHDSTSEARKKSTVVTLPAISPGSDLLLSIGPNPQLSVTSPEEHLFPILNAFQTDFSLKEAIWQAVTAKVPLGIKMGKLQALEMREAMLNAVLEILIADSRCK